MPLEMTIVILIAYLCLTWALFIFVVEAIGISRMLVCLPASSSKRQQTDLT